MRTKGLVGKNAGFSLVETLVTTAVLVILMALTFVAIFTYKKHLDITELDNAAREIYMAAQNRAVLLKNRDRLAELVEKEDPENPGTYINQLDDLGDSTKKYYYVSKKNILDMKDQELLPAESIESSLWSGYFYIVYELQSGSVTDVFYAEEPFFEEGLTDALYAEYREKSRDERMDLVPMIGYYGGTSSEAGDTYTPRTPMLRIINDNELTVEVTCWLPKELVDVGKEDGNVQMNLTLEYGSQKVELCRVTLSNYTITPPPVTEVDGGDFALANDAVSRFKANEKKLDDTDPDYYKYVCTYVLDSLEPKKQFKDLGAFADGSEWTTPLGRDFTVTAEISYSGSSRLINGATKTATDNSLFATSSLGNTAHIGCMRHLQNLDSKFSDVDKDAVEDGDKVNADIKYFAIQIADIENIEIGGGKLYNFIPINNSNLLLYDGSDHSIYNLYEYWSDKYYLGLFAQFMPDKKEDFFGSNPDYRDRGLYNIHLVNASIFCGVPEMVYVGALSGVVLNADIVNCSVYWTPEKNEDLQGVRKKLGMTSYDEGYKLDEYKIEAIGTSICYVGGLVGMMMRADEAEASISNCFVATTINSGEFAGGLVGMAGGVKIENSYADCYIRAKNAAGLVGEANDIDGNGFEIINCFATGYISVDSEVDSHSAGLGLLGGNANTLNVENSYVAIVYNKPDSADPDQEKEIQNRYPLVPKGDNITIHNSHYLYSPYVNNELYPEWMVSYDQLSDDSKWTTLFGSAFTKKAPNNPSVEYYTHPYNLQDGITLENYPYPAFEDLPHYGDWPEAHQKGYLVYWEKYNDGAGSLGIKGAEVEADKLVGLPSLKEATDGLLVVEDGYAVYLPSDLVPTAGDSTITIRFERSYKTLTSEGTKDEVEVVEMTYGLNLTESDLQAKLIPVTPPGGTTYYLAPLPKNWVEPGSVASSDFYQKLHITVENSTNPTTYFFNPHFASTVISAEYAAEKPDESLAKNVSVRSSRHIYELSKYSEYFHNSGKYTFHQELNLDYSQYTGYNLFAAGGGSGQQDPIGNEDAPFTQTYDGGHHTIINAPLQTSGGSDVGLFGCNEGSVQNVVFLGNGVIDRKTGSGSPAKVISGTVAEPALNIGALVGHNGEGGKIDGCAVAYIALSINGTGTGKVRCGGLVGYNEGSIFGSAATLDSIEIGGSGSATYVGGLVGRNDTGATISSCYAIGRMTGDVSVSGIVVGGFAGYNSGKLQRSYTAYDLNPCAAATKYAFSSENGEGVTNCYYLNNGSFTYLDGDVFQANYVSNGVGEAQTWNQLTDASGAGTLSQLNAGDNAFGAPGAKKYAFSGENYVFPAVVKDAAGAYVHYGDWPEKAEDGLMGLFYWEREIKQPDDTGEYHVSAIVIDPNESTVRKVSNLCTDHSDGGVIKEYGYGYFYNGSLGESVTCVADGNLGLKDAEDLVHAAKVDSALIKASFKSAVENVGIDIDDSGYEFNAYQTIDMDSSKTNTERHWMYLINGATSSTWTLELNAGAETKKYLFNVNPFFGESLSLATIDGLVVASGVPRGELGTNDLPFETRSVEQLQYINWNHDKHNTNTVVECNKIGNLLGLLVHGKGNGDEFTFLSYSIPRRTSTLEGFALNNNDFFWRQCHDFCGNEEVTYTPIATFKDISENGSEAFLSAWFGGEYDGANYEIQDLKIAADQSNCLGLFGVTMNATLKNIVMSVTEEGKGTVTGHFAGGVESWYALGGLVGLAASCDLGGTPTATTIDNCAIAGYKIIDEHKDLNGAVGGVGGLVGMGNAKITGSSAVTEIEIDSTSATSTWSTAVRDSNIYAGGIAGTSQQSIEYSYAGGSISLGKDFALSNDSNLTMGSLQGSGSAKTLNVGIGRGISVERRSVIQNRKGSISYSYSYVTLPDALPTTRGTLIRYAIGDASSYRSCYYLQSAVPDGAIVNDVSSCTYEQLSGKVNKVILDDLNSAAGEKRFAYLTDDNGVHSHPTSAHLENMDYPFPAILTGVSDVPDTLQYVHYGDWPLDGIVRTDGGMPIALDTFADYRKPDTAATKEPEKSGGAYKEITLFLSSLLQQSLSSAGGAGSTGRDPLGQLTVSVEPVETAGGEGESEGGTGGTTGSTGGSEGGTSGTDVVEIYFLDMEGNKLATPIDITNDNKNDPFCLVILAKTPGSVNVVVKCRKPAAAGGEEAAISTLTIPVTITAVVNLLPARLNGAEIVSDTATPQVILLGADATSGTGTPGTSGAPGTGTPGTGVGEEEIVSTIALYPFDKNGNPLPADLLSQIDIVGSGEIVPAVAAASLNEIPLNTISANAVIGNEEMGAALEGADGTGHFELKVSGKMEGLTPATSSIKVSYSYTYSGKTYTAETEIPVSVKKAQLTADSANIELESADVSGGDVLPSATPEIYGTKKLHLTLNGASENITDLRIAGVTSVNVEFETTGSGNTGSGTTEPGTTESENAGSGNREPGPTGSENAGPASGDSESEICVKAELQADGTLRLTPQKCGTETLRLVVEFTYSGNKYRMTTDLVVTVGAVVQAANMEVSGGDLLNSDEISGGDLLISGEVSGGDPVASGISALANVFKSEPAVRKPVDGVRCDEDGLFQSPFKSARDVSDGDLRQ